MNINTKRLATDAAYWDELAIPEKAKWAAIKNGSLVGWALYSMGDESVLGIEMIPRPKAQDAEWVDGVPPVGAVCEVIDPKNGEWSRIRVTAHGEKAILAKWERLDDTEFALNKRCLFRTLRTAKQRQRDELAELISNEIREGKILGRGLADTIIAAGWIKP